MGGGGGGQIDGYSKWINRLNDNCMKDRELGVHGGGDRLTV